MSLLSCLILFHFRLSNWLRFKMIQMCFWILMGMITKMQMVKRRMEWSNHYLQLALLRRKSAIILEKSMKILKTFMKKNKFFSKLDKTFNSKILTLSTSMMPFFKTFQTFNKSYWSSKKVRRKKLMTIFSNCQTILINTNCLKWSLIRLLINLQDNLKKKSNFWLKTLWRKKIHLKMKVASCL